MKSSDTLETILNQSENHRDGAILPPDDEGAPSAATPEQAQSMLRVVFFGRDGLRAGWGILLFALMFGAFMGAASFAVHKLHHPRKAVTVASSTTTPAAVRPTTVKAMYINEGLLLLAVVVATWGMAKVEGRCLGSYGFGGQAWVRYLLGGFLWGLVFLSALVGTLWKSGLLKFDGRMLFGMDTLKYGAIWMGGYFLVAFFEEGLFRGYMQFTASRGLAGIYRSWFGETKRRQWGFWTAAALFAVGFGSIHGMNAGESPVGLVSAGLIGLVFCLSLWRTGSLWWALGFHASWDWAQSFLFGVADSGTMLETHLMATHPVGKVLLSGGATGPEGSILILPTLVLITLVVWRLPSNRGLDSVADASGI